MSTILVDNLTGKTSAGSITVTSEGGAATQSLQQGLAKAWVQYNTSHVVQDSFNVASVTDVGTGQGTINISNAMNNAGYSLAYSSGITGPAVNGLRISAMATSSYSTQQVNNSGSYTDSDFCCTSVKGDLA